MDMKNSIDSEEKKHIGLILGDEEDLPNALVDAVAEIDAEMVVEYVMLDHVGMDQPNHYDVIVDRMSHKIPFYRHFLKQAALQGSYVINNPFMWSADDRFLGICLLNKLGIATPRTIILPNKSVAAETTPTSFRNLKYPLNWEGIIEYVGVPAIFKGAHTGGRNLVYRVHNVDDLIDWYDQSSDLTMLLQEIVQGEQFVHCFVIGQKETLLVEYSLDEKRYLPSCTPLSDLLKQEMVRQALAVTKLYGYDINLVEFVVRDGQLLVINPTNPAPQIDLTLLSVDDFNWCVTKIAAFVVMAAHSEPERSFYFIGREINNNDVPQA